MGCSHGTAITSIETGGEEDVMFFLLLPMSNMSKCKCLPTCQESFSLKKISAVAVCEPGERRVHD